MNRKKYKKTKKPPKEGCVTPEISPARRGAEEAIFHLRMIQHGAHIVELYRSCFPSEFREHGIDYTSGKSVLDSYDRFTHLVDKYLFPVWPFSALGGIFDEPAYCLETMSICLYGGNYFFWERMQDLPDLPIVEKLIVNAYGEGARFDEVDFAPPGDEIIFDWNLLRQACEREKGQLALLPLAAEAVLGQTGNFWLDMTEEMYYQAEEPEWNETNIDYFASEWIEAKDMKKDVERFFEWVGCNYTRVEKVKRLLRKAWRPMKQTARVRTHSGKPLVETLGGVF